jgi:hypothetical protein
MDIRVEGESTMKARMLKNTKLVQAARSIPGRKGSKVVLSKRAKESDADPEWRYHDEHRGGRLSII